MEKFDYIAATEELEKIAVKVEDPATPLGEMDACMKRASELIASCRKYLRSEREKLDGYED